MGHKTVTDMRSMFAGIDATSLDISHFDTSNVEDMGGMFRQARYLTSLDLSNFDTSNVIWMYAMFDNTNSLSSLTLSTFI